MGCSKRPAGALAIQYCMVMFLILSAASCARRQESMPSSMAVALPPAYAACGADPSWRTCRFKIAWPQGAEVDWAVDLMLAHAVVGPALEAHGRQICWWRFHRRAARDGAGHQFSFLFYAGSRTAVEVMADIRQNRILRQALEQGILERVVCEDPEHSRRPQVGSMSDPHWPPTLKKNWPSFIMGASALWLGLIDDATAEAAAGDDVLGLLEQYRQARTSVNAIWHGEGQHAFLHHLNALFGYEPLRLHHEINF
jgi:hypothetical protein